MKNNTHSDQHAHKGLAHDLEVMATTLSRRGILHVFAGAVIIPVVGCGSMSTNSNTDAATGTDVTTPDASSADVVVTDAPATDSSITSCTTIPTETAGPYPGDGTNGANALVIQGIVRRDIRSSFAGAGNAVAPGVPLTVNLALVDANGNCVALSGYAIYLWHCDRDGNYSMYSAAAAAQNYLRGVQETGSDGKATFTSIFPAAYSGRWPHMHFEIYRNLAAATTGRNAVRTSQLALPEAACRQVYATEGYAASIANLAATSLARDNVFGDGSTLQLATIEGNVTQGFTATLVIAIGA
jgi:protocatechuate 3,4-dioxygenase beta subunit